MASINLYSKEQTDTLLGAKANSSDVTTALAGKQDTLVSGTNIKSINGTSVLGSGDIVISGSGVSLTDHTTYYTLTIE